MKKILIIGGSKKTNNAFKNKTQKDSEIITAFFQDLNFIIKDNKYTLKVKDIALDEFDVVYLKVIGKFREHAAIISYYCKKKNIPLQDPIFTQTEFTEVPIFKGLETLLLADNNVQIPITGFVTLKSLIKFTTNNFPFPCVIKDTEGMQGKGAYIIENKTDLENLHKKLKEKFGDTHFYKKYLVQEFIHASHRHRIFIIDNEVLAGIIRPMRWRKKFTPENSPDYEGIKKSLSPIPEDEIRLSLQATKAVKLGIAGVDLIVDDETGKKYIMEVNASPQWGSLSKDNNINVEEYILKYLNKIAK